MIKRILFFLALLLILFLIFFYDYRTSSKIRFEQASNTKIPDGFKVIKDEYEGMKDYLITYSIEFNNLSAKKYTQNIMASGYYYPLKLPDCPPESMSHKGIWGTKENGFQFQQYINGTAVTIEFDTISNRATFVEDCQ